MRIEFDPAEHRYHINDNLAHISVTQLLAKHGLAPNYGKVNKDTLTAAAERGTMIHKDCENVINRLDYEPETPQGASFAEWVTENIDAAIAEQLIGYEYEGMYIGGTADLIGFLKDGSAFIADHKTTSAVNKEYVAWQVSLLDYFLRQLISEPINGRMMRWKGADLFYCFHYDEDGAMKVIELDKVPDEQIVELLNCEYADCKYQRPALVLDSELAERYITAEKKLALIETQRKEAEDEARKLRELLCTLFETQGVTKWESVDGMVKVTYVPATDRLSVDSTKLKEQYPAVYDNCLKLSKVKAQVRIKIKGGEDDD